MKYCRNSGAHNWHWWRMHCRTLLWTEHYIDKIIVERKRKKCTLKMHWIYTNYKLQTYITKKYMMILWPRTICRTFNPNFQGNIFPLFYFYAIAMWLQWQRECTTLHFIYTFLLSLLLLCARVVSARTMCIVHHSIYIHILIGRYNICYVPNATPCEKKLLD